VGSGSDITARLLAGYLGPILGQTVVVENRAGASGIIGHQSVARAAPDGYTLLFTSTAGLFVVPVMNPNAKYSLADFVPVAPVMRAPFVVLVANTPTAPKTLAELLAEVQAKPQSFASAGVGTMTHLGTELVLRKAGVQATHVPYKGSGAALTDLIGGQVLFATDSLTASMTHIKSGKLRALATTDMAREGSLPDVPTLAQAGVPGVQIAAIGGLFAPKGTPQDVVDKIAAATAKALANPDVAQRFAAVETDPLKVTIPAFNDMLRKEADVWSPLVRQLGLKQE
jgi:tripartite-type tricarboxylate transporter receptor subunit TctC